MVIDQRTPRGPLLPHKQVASGVPGHVPDRVSSFETLILIIPALNTFVSLSTSPVRSTTPAHETTLRYLEGPGTPEGTDVGRVTPKRQTGPCLRPDVSRHTGVP